MTRFVALTAYGVEIASRYLPDRKTALDQAPYIASDFPGCRIVMRSPSGQRTIWRDEDRRAAA